MLSACRASLALCRRSTLRVIAVAAGRSLTPRVVCAPALSQARYLGNRRFLSMAPAEASDQTELSFHRLADEELDRLLEAFEELGDTSEIAGFDVTLSSGVLTVALGPTHGTYVINKQPPNQQIWLSSPFSGPARFAYDARHRKWINVRQTPASWKQSPSGTLEGLLQSELKDRVGFEVSLV